jgi:hypothetical protein
MSAEETAPSAPEAANIAPLPTEPGGDANVGVGKSALAVAEPFSAPPPRPRSGGIRRGPKPRMTGLLDSPTRNLTFGIIRHHLCRAVKISPKLWD